MSFNHLLKVSIFLFVSLLSSTLLDAQVFASLNPTLTEEGTTEIDNAEWLSVAEKVLYPSKSDQTTTLEYTLTKAKKITIDLSDMKGRIIKIYTRNAKRNAGDYTQKLALPYGLPKGTYFLNIASANDKVTVKVRHD